MNEPNHGADKWAPYPFAYKAAQYRDLSDAALAWSITDARKASECWHEVGVNHAGNSPGLWYLDDMHTLIAERGRRQGKH